MFQILDQVSLNPKDAKCVSAKQNPKKNRYAEFLPGNCIDVDVFLSLYIHLCIYNTWMTHAVDRWRVVLKGETPDYINATNVHVSIWGYYIL